MNWLNEPPAWDFSNNILSVTTGAGTDFWRGTHYGFYRDSGHFFSREIAGDFIAEVKFEGQYRALYDQAGLMIRLDERNWIKCGIEYVAGVQQASVVVTREFSDWSVLPLETNPSTLWLRLSRRKEAVEVQYSLDGREFAMLRLAYLPSTASAWVGPMCASPEGEGFEVRFERFSISPLAS